MADSYLAEIRPFAGSQAPKGWHFCDGTLLPISANQALFSLIGTNFGGNGTTNFALPDLRSRVAVGVGQSLMGSNYVMGEQAGNESVTLTPNTMPAHSHTFMVSSAAATTNAPSNTVFANPDPNIAYATTPVAGSPEQVLLPDSVGNSGGNQAHENRMPSLAINFIIALVGIYPSQS